MPPPCLPSLPSLPADDDDCYDCHPPEYNRDPLPQETAAQINAIQVTFAGAATLFVEEDRWPPTGCTLQRVVTSQSADGLSGSLHTTKSDVYTLEILDRVRCGALYTAFEAKLAGHRVMAKFTKLASFPLDDRRRPPHYDGHTIETALQALRNEETAYLQLPSRLPEDDRKFVPRNYGLFRVSSSFRRCRRSQCNLFDPKFERMSVYCRIEEYIARDVALIEQEQTETM